MKRTDGHSQNRQCARVYAWEDAVVAAADTSVVPFAAAQGMVDAIWLELDLRYPRRWSGCRDRRADCKRTVLDCGCGCQHRSRRGCYCTNWLTPLSSTEDGASDGHGPMFMGLYVQLLTRYLRLSAPTLIQSAADAGIAIDPNARPLFFNIPKDGGLPRTSRAAVVS